MDCPQQPRKNEIVVYQPDETLRLETRYAAESIWLPQLPIAQLFGVQKAAISKHLKNIYATGELKREATVSKMETVAKFNAQYPALTLRFKETFHDRFLVIDDSELYLIGASLKDLGKKCFAFTRLDPSEIPGITARI